MHGTSYRRIVGIDLGKFNSVACLFDPADSSHRFQSLATTPQAVHDLLSGLIATPDDAAEVLVVFETCEVCGWVHDVASALGFPVAVANPCHEAWRWTKVKRKTDKDDALKLAKMAVLNQLPTVHVPSPEMRQRRRLVHHRGGGRSPSATRSSAAARGRRTRSARSSHSRGCLCRRGARPGRGRASRS